MRSAWREWCPAGEVLDTWLITSTQVMSDIWGVVYNTWIHHVTRIDESCPTYALQSCLRGALFRPLLKHTLYLTHEWVTSHIWTNRVPGMHCSAACTAPCFTHYLHTSRVSLINESCPTYGWSMCYWKMSHVPTMDESRASHYLRTSGVPDIHSITQMSDFPRMHCSAACEVACFTDYVHTSHVSHMNESCPIYR